MSGKRLRVVIADDHPALLDSLRSLLSASYHVVATAADGQALVQAAIDERPDLIVTDICMPGLGGLDAAERVKIRLPAVRVVIFTVDEDRDTVAEALRRGADGYVVKSAGASMLLDAMTSVMEGRKCVTWT